MTADTVHYNRDGKPLCGADDPNPSLGGIITCEKCRSRLLVSAFGQRSEP